MDKKRKGASTAQKVGGGILSATVVLAIIGFVYGTRNIKTN